MSDFSGLSMENPHFTLDLFEQKEDTIDESFDAFIDSTIFTSSYSNSSLTNYSLNESSFSTTSITNSSCSNLEGSDINSFPSYDIKNLDYQPINDENSFITPRSSNLVDDFPILGSISSLIKRKCIDKSLPFSDSITSPDRSTPFPPSKLDLMIRSALSPLRSNSYPNYSLASATPTNNYEMPSIFSPSSLSPTIMNSVPQFLPTTISPSELTSPICSYTPYNLSYLTKLCNSNLTNLNNAPSCIKQLDFDSDDTSSESNYEYPKLKVQGGKLQTRLRLLKQVPSIRFVPPKVPELIPPINDLKKYMSDSESVKSSSPISYSSSQGSTGSNLSSETEIKKRQMNTFEGRKNVYKNHSGANDLNARGRDVMTELINSEFDRKSIEKHKIQNFDIHCSYCSKKHRNYWDFILHLKSKNCKKGRCLREFQCIVTSCPFFIIGFQRKQCLRHHCHDSHFHNGRVTEACQQWKSKLEELSFMCSDCGKSFFRRDSLSRHIRLHSDPNSKKRKRRS